MKKNVIKIILFNLLLIVSVKGVCQNLQLNNRIEKITVLSDTSFKREISISLEMSDEAIVLPVFYDTELEEVSDVKVFYQKGKRYKLLEDPFITDEDVDLEQITSKKIKSIVIPPGGEHKVNYTVKCKELMYFTDLPVFSYNDLDTLIYQVSIPETFTFSYNLIYNDSLDYLIIDSVKTDSLTRWNIKATPIKIMPDPMVFFGIYRNLKMPLARIIVTPLAYKNREKNYLNDWFLRKAEASRGLDSNSMAKIDELTQGITEPLKVIDTLYNFVRTNFKYVAIEVGMGAFIPSPANEVFHNKYGDCKDLSNFLSEALNYKGIKSNIAMAATYDHISDCDFPSLCCANHVVCVAFVNNKSIVLDPTDPIHIPQTPVQGIQNRYIFILNPEGGQYIKVEPFSPQQNLINYNIELNTDSDKLQMDGHFNVEYLGISGNFLRYYFLDKSIEEMSAFSEDHFETVFGDQTIKNVKVNHYSGDVNISGEISVKGKIINGANTQFLFLDFLPQIFESEYRKTLLEGTHIGNTLEKKVVLRIKMNKPFEAFSPIEYEFDDKGASLRIAISNPLDNIIECNYDFVFDYIFIENKNLNITNKMLKSFKEIINEPIILKNSSL